MSRQHVSERVVGSENAPLKGAKPAGKRPLGSPLGPLGHHPLQWPARGL
jgi:hypothetical protein